MSKNWPRPMSKLYQSPRDLLEKAKRNRDRLAAHISERDIPNTCDALFDFAVTAHAIKDWIVKSHPTLKADADNYLSNVSELRACQDIANGSKHDALDPDREPLKHRPMEVEDLGISAQGSTTVCGLDSLISHIEAPEAKDANVKVVYMFERVRADDFATKVITAWERFFAEKKL